MSILRNRLEGVHMEVEIDENDILIQFYRSSGPGGQHRNVTDSAVRIRHLPSGITVSASESRSQTRNREVAMVRLKEALERKNRKMKKRIPTRVPNSAVEKRLAEKKRKSETKRQRRPSME